MGDVIEMKKRRGMGMYDNVSRAWDDDLYV
jgi:hypothetical protein